jgi:hypothetical protein
MLRHQPHPTSPVNQFVRAGDHMCHRPHHRSHQHHRSTPKTPGTVNSLRRSRGPHQGAGDWRIERVEFVLMTTAQNRAATNAWSALIVEWITQRHATTEHKLNDDHTKAA